MILKGYVLRSRSRSGAKRAMGEEVWEGGEGIDRQAVWSRWESGPFATIALVSKKKIQVQFGYRRSREKNPPPNPSLPQRRGDQDDHVTPHEQEGLRPLLALPAASSTKQKNKSRQLWWFCVLIGFRESTKSVVFSLFSFFFFVPGGEGGMSHLEGLLVRLVVDLVVVHGLLHLAKNHIQVLVVGLRSVQDAHARGYRHKDRQLKRGSASG